jgi:hypothetical protein
MTHTPDDPNDPADGGARGRDEGARGKLDEDAAWREIIAHYGDEPAIEELLADDDASPAELQEPPAPDQPVAGSDADSDERLRGLFRPTWDDPMETGATWDDEGHFVPPSPPPARVQDPRRGIAWLGLFGSPFVMLLAVVLQLTLPHWLLFLLAVGFTGGFVYLVATMPNRRGGPGDDGAVV